MQPLVSLLSFLFLVFVFDFGFNLVLGSCYISIVQCSANDLSENLFKHLQPTRLTWFADGPVCPLESTFKLVCLKVCLGFYFPLDSSRQQEVCGHIAYKLLNAPYGCLIPCISLLNFWLVCCSVPYPNRGHNLRLSAILVSLLIATETLAVSSDYHEHRVFCAVFYIKSVPTRRKTVAVTACVVIEKSCTNRLRMEWEHPQVETLQISTVLT